MKDFEQALTQLSFSNLTSTAFHDQPCNHSCLSKQDTAEGNDLPAISLPYVGFTELHDAAGWQVAFADIPVTQFPPIVYRRAENHVGRFNSRRIFPFENAKRHFGTLCAE